MATTSGIRCKICDQGTLLSKEVFRMSGPVVAIGFILLIPSIIGIATGLLILSLSLSANDHTSGILSGFGAVSGIGACIASFVAGIFGWLLVMRKHVLECSACGATINASKPPHRLTGQVPPQTLDPAAPEATNLRTAAHWTRVRFALLVFTLGASIAILFWAVPSSGPGPTTNSGPAATAPDTASPSGQAAQTPEAVTPQAAAGSASPANQAATAPEQAVPPDEAEFVSTLSSFATRYVEVPNEFQKSTVRKDRARAFAGVLPNLSIKDWIGQVSSMETTSDGEGILCVKLGGNPITTVRTRNTSFSDIFSDVSDATLIRQGSSLYDQLGHLAVGDKVVFSGTFARGNLDYMREASLTEEGAMTDPEFIFTFATVRPANEAQAQAAQTQAEAQTTAAVLQTVPQPTSDHEITTVAPAQGGVGISTPTGAGPPMASQVLDQWVSTAKSCDVAGHSSLYDDTVASFYTKRNLTKTDVANEITNICKTYSSFPTLTLSAVSWLPLSPGLVQVQFDKEFRATKREGGSYQGSVHSETHSSADNWGVEDCRGEGY